MMDRIVTFPKMTLVMSGIDSIQGSRAKGFAAAVIAFVVGNGVASNYSQLLSGLRKDRSSAYLAAPKKRSRARLKNAAPFTVQMLPLTICVMSHSINHLSKILTPHRGAVRD